jgi:hypothetical protein
MVFETEFGSFIMIVISSNSCNFPFWDRVSDPKNEEFNSGLYRFVKLLYLYVGVD